MQTKLSVFAAKISEAGWLAALIIVPLIFNVYTERVFEEDKLPLMRSIALMVFIGLLIWGIERGREALRLREQPFWKVPLVLPTLVLTGSYLLATAFSIVPRVSFWGAYIRRQGTYTWLGYIAIFFAILFLVRHRRQAERIVTIVLLTSIPATLYGLLQNQGLDPLPWGGDVIQRISSTAGNPIFIAAYLIMVFPLTLMRVIEHFKRLLKNTSEDEPTPNYLASALLVGGYLFLLILQLITIFFSQSRGPLIGMLVGMTFFAILYSLHISRWLTVTMIGLVIAGIVFIVTFNLPNSPLASLRDVPYIGRLGQLTESSEGTGRVRVLIWGGATELLASNPLRTLIGYGPESMHVAYNPFYPSELAQIEARNASPDRSHNETFDSLITIGVIGFTAQTFLFLSLFYYTLSWLGVINSAAQRNLFIGLVVAGGSAGAILPYLLEGQFRYLGVGLPAGIAAGLIAYLLIYSISHLRAEEEPVKSRDALLIALLAAVIAHFVEIHFGIAIGVTRLYFWSYAALAVAVGWTLSAPGEDEVEIAVPVEASADAAVPRRKRRSQRRTTETAQGSIPLLTGTLIGLSLMMALILIVMMFDFYNPNVSLSDKNFALVWLFMLTWLLGALAVSAEAMFEQSEEVPWVPTISDWLKRVGVYSAITLGSWLIFIMFYLPWVQWRPQSVDGAISIEQLQGYASHLANTMGLVYLATFTLMTLAALAFLRDEPTIPRATLRQPQWQATIYGLLLAGIIPVITMTNLNISRADVFSKQGFGHESNRQWDAAEILYKEALRLQPDEDRYFLNMGRTLMEKARTLSDNIQQRDLYLQEARAILERAQNTNPLNTDHTRNLASLHRAWAGMISDPTARAQHLDTADGYYERAVQLSPNNAALWNDWASLKAEQGLYDEAIIKLEQSLIIDSRWVDTYQLHASISLDQLKYEQALADYEHILQLRPNSLPALSGKAFALAKLERLDEAISTTLQALALDPSDYTSYKNLALLYQEDGQYEEALRAAHTALSLAAEEDIPSIQGLIQQLNEQKAGGDSGG
ncbi:MAG: O-antigen ligase family protein [Ardenticatenales bacterium]|nr:O-antigen ligase family protein [Ardenticatenales bacterium]